MGNGACFSGVNLGFANCGKKWPRCFRMTVCIGWLYLITLIIYTCFSSYDVTSVLKRLFTNPIEQSCYTLERESIIASWIRHNHYCQVTRDSKTPPDLFSSIHSSCQNATKALIEPKLSKQSSTGDPDSSQTPKLCQENTFVTVVPYHNITDRLDAFLRHQNEIMQANEKTQLVISTQKSDQSYVEKALLELMSQSAKSRTFVVYSEQDVFSRGRARNTGANFAISKFGSDITIFFCDVDVFGSLNFIKRCQSLVVPTETVYYPVLWSVKKPSSTQSGKNTDIFPEDFTESHLVSKEDFNTYGYYRTYGYGMLCINGLDFQSTKKYPEFNHWGFEDTNFYKEIRDSSSLSVLRFNDPGLMHKWHPKECNEKDKAQYWIFKKLGFPSACERVKTANG